MIEELFSTQPPPRNDENKFGDITGNIRDLTIVDMLDILVQHLAQWGSDVAGL